MWADQFAREESTKEGIVIFFLVGRADGKDGPERGTSTAVGISPRSSFMLNFVTMAIFRDNRRIAGPELTFWWKYSLMGRIGVYREDTSGRKRLTQEDTAYWIIYCQP